MHWSFMIIIVYCNNFLSADEKFQWVFELLFTEGSLKLYEMIYVCIKHTAGVGEEARKVNLE